MVAPIGRNKYYAACGGSAASGSENQTTAPAARWKCTPSVACGDVSPGGGDSSGATL